MTNKINSIESNLIQDLSNKESENINGGSLHGGLVLGTPVDIVGPSGPIPGPVISVPFRPLPIVPAGTLAINIRFGLTSPRSGRGRSHGFW